MVFHGNTSVIGSIDQFAVNDSLILSITIANIDQVYGNGTQHENSEWKGRRIYDEQKVILLSGTHGIIGALLEEGVLVSRDALNHKHFVPHKCIMRSFYDILEVAEDVSYDEVKKTYYNYLRRVHPDTGGDI
uniref:J domain-containing protein n=1 Tax=Heterorhabditis bacteriophora TaxID=37862 RepID=A0A1I7W811_HETBA